MQTDEYSAGSSAIASGSTANSQTSYLSLALAGGTNGIKLSFDWKASSEADYNKLKVYLDTSTPPNTTTQGEIFGEVDWLRKSVVLFPNASYTMRFCYEKDISQSSGYDKGYIDNISLDNMELSGYLATDFSNSVLRESDNRLFTLTKKPL